MEKYQILPGTSTVNDRCRFIPFVSSAGDDQIIAKRDASSKGKLDGREASQFYREVISTPSNFQSSVANEHKKKSKSVKKKSIAPSVDHARLTVFHHAQNGSVEGVKYHLSNRCSVDIQDMYGWTPLMCATFEGHYSVADYLIKQGANLDLKNKQGLTALDIALSKNNVQLIDLLNNRVKEESHDIEDYEIQEVEKYCDLCNSSFTESTVKHNRSIAHLFADSSHSESVSTYYHIPEDNKGFQIMLKKGWDKNKGLGADAKGRKFPIKTVLKTDRSCIGGRKEVPKVTHFGAKDGRAVRRNIQPTLNLKRETKLNKHRMKKLQERNRRVEIEFRRQFH